MLINIMCNVFSMPKKSLEISVELDQRLKHFLIDRYGNDHGRQQEVFRDALIAFLDANETRSTQAEAECEAVAVECVVEPLAKEVPPTAKPVKPRKTKHVAKKKAFKDDTTTVPSTS